MVKSKINEEMKKIYQIYIPKYNTHQMIIVKDGVPIFWSEIHDDIEYFLQQEKKIIAKRMRKGNI